MTQFPLTEEQLANRESLIVKITHLATEPAIIKRRIAKLKKARLIFTYRAAKVSESGSNEPQRGFVGGWAVVKLREHRLRVVRPEARAALVAYAFIRGKDYGKTETPVKSQPDWVRVAEIALKYGAFPLGTTKVEAKRDIVAWASRSLSEQSSEAA